MNLTESTHNELQEFIADNQRFHSELQMDSFITSREGRCHIWGMYKQAIRELTTRHDSLRRLEGQIELLKIDIEEIEHTDFSDQYALRRSRVFLQQKKHELETLERLLPDRLREFNRFFKQAQATKALIGEVSPERRNELDKSYWLHRLRLKLAVELRVSGEPGFWIYEILYTLPEEMRSALQSDLDHPERLEAYYAGLAKQLETGDKPLQADSVAKLLG